MNQGHGGAGGIVIYTGKTDYGDIDTAAHGGLGGKAFDNSEPIGCSAGASGTIYWENEDSLLINNRDINSSQSTIVTTDMDRDKENYPGERLVARNLFID